MTTSLHCCRCDYDLTGLAADKLCPECGTSVSETLRATTRVPRAAAWACAASLLLGAATPFLFMLVLSTRSIVRKIWDIPKAYAAEQLLMLLWVAVGGIGWFILTRPLRHRAENTAAGLLRSIIALNAVCLIAFCVLWWAISRPSESQEALFQATLNILRYVWLIWCIPGAFIIARLRVTPARVLRTPVLIFLVGVAALAVLARTLPLGLGNLGIPMEVWRLSLAVPPVVAVIFAVVLVLLKPRAVPKPRVQPAPLPDSR